MPEGSRRGSQRSPSTTAAKRPSSVSSLSGIVGRMMSSGERGASSSSCTSVNTVCSDGERPASLSLSSSASSVSLQDASHSSSSSSSSSSLPYGAVPTYNASSSSSSSSTPKRNGSDISLDLTPLVTPHGGGLPGGGGVSVARATGGHPPNGNIANAMPVAVAAAATPRQLSRLERVVMEIVETEQAYVRDLKSIVEDYLGCIIDCGALPLKPDQVSTLFCNIEDIYEFNSDLLEDLERSPHAAAIAECFVERSEAFDIYTLYCMNYPNSVAVLRECMKNECLVRFFQERQTTLNHSLPLETYLLKPVQRILKYHLLLQELSKHFDKSAPGYEVVEDAIITMTAVAWYINDMKRKQEHAVRLQEIESLLVNWSGPDLSGFGELVLEGSFKVHRVKKERAFFLFDKMLLIAKKRLEQFVYSTHIFCCNLLLVETLKDPLCFKVSDQTIPKQQHIVQTKNQEEKRLWVHYLKRLIVENHPASLPQKARQVLGDNFCQSPQFDQDNLKKSSASPRLDDIHGYHRGRRQSGQEPPELLMYTPEKSRKSLPLLLEGNLPYRRTRRQSAPAKDIEAAFHPNALKQAGSEGELCQADSLGSAGSSSTLASSVIEVEAERAELGLTPQLRPNQEEEEEEDLSPLSPPPTLSITEEILEFINQSRAREGLTSIHTDATVLDQPKESQSPTNQTNFTCPLPPAACPSSPEQRPTMQQEQESEEMEDNRILQSQSGGPSEDNGFEKETITNEVKEITDATSQVEKGVEADEEIQGEGEEKEKERKKTMDEGEGESITPAPTSNLHPSISAAEERENSSSCHLTREETSTEATTPSPKPDLPHHLTQRRQPPTRGCHLTKRDKKIIEKIRSYYEAAAEAEEDEAEEEDEQGEGVASRRRSSFSQIPSGLVKESVSRFDVGGHQGETESGQSKYETTEVIETDQETEPCPPTGPISFPAPLSADAENDKQADKPISSLNVDAEGPADTPASTMMQDKKTPNQVGLNLQSNQNRSFGEETEIQDKNEKLCKGPLEERQEGKTSVAATGEQHGNSLQGEGPSKTKPYTCRDETTKTCAGNQAVMNGHEPNRADPAEPKGSHKDSCTPVPPTDQCQKTETKTQSTWTTPKHRDLVKTSGNLEGLPSQIKVGRWSRHSRIVTANRALFEGMGSDVAGIGLFESSPVVDPVLIENSERILSKVQTLARMYSAKASTMKVPLHQKRVSSVRNQSWGSGRLSGHSAQTQTKSQTQVQSQTQKQTQTKNWLQTQHQMEVNQTDTCTETKTGTQTHSETKVQNQTATQTRQQSQIQTKSQMWSQTQTHYQNQTKTHSQYQTQTMILEDQTIQEERVIKRAESLTSDLQRTAIVPCEPQLFGHVFVKEQLTSACHHQTNEFTLSRPRDFISALTKERDSSVCGRSGDNSQTSTIPGENPAISLRDQSSSQVQANSDSPGHHSTDRPEASAASRHHLRAQPEDQSSSLCCSATNSPLTSSLTLDCTVTEFRDLCSTSSAGRVKALNQSRQVYTDTEETDQREGSEQSAGHPVYSVSEDSTSVNVITQPAHRFKQDIAPVQDIQDKPEYKISIGHADNKDTLTKNVQSVSAEPEYLVCTKIMDEEASLGELVLTAASTQDQALTQHHSSTVPHPGEQAHLEEEGGSTTVWASGGPKKVELSTETKDDFNSSSQTRMILHDSTVIFSEETPYQGPSRELVAAPSLSQPLHLTFDLSQVSSRSIIESPEDYKVREGAAPSPRPSVQNSESNPTQPRSPSVQPMDCLPTFTSQRPPDLPTTMGKRALSNTWNVNNTTPYEYREPDQQDSGSPSSLPVFSLPSDSCPPSTPSVGTANLVQQPNPASSTQSQDTELTSAPSAFRPSLRHRSPSPVRAPTSSPLLPSPSSVRAPPCSSPFRVVPASSPTPGSVENIISSALSCLSPTPPSGKVSSMRAPPASSPTPSTAFTPSSSSSGTPSSARAGLPSSPTPPSSLRSSPIASSSAFTRSLAASCISQSISQSLAKKNAARQQAPPINLVNQSTASVPSLPSSHLRRRSPSPKLLPSQQSSSTPSYVQPGHTKDGYQQQRCPPCSLQSSCPSPAPVQSPPPSFLHRSPSPSMSQTHHQPAHSSSSASSRPSFLHSKTDSLQNANNSNNNVSLAGLATAISNVRNTSSYSINGAVTNGAWSGSPLKTTLANGSTNATVVQQAHDPLWLGSHNRVARPFSASEPSSRVQSPSPSPTPASFTRLCSPPPQHNYSSPMANKPPHPRSTRAVAASSHNPLGLTLELPRASSASSAFIQSSSCLSPRILSPPPIGVSVNVWTNNVAAPQPRNPRFASSSPSSPFSSSLGSSRSENASFPTSSSSSVPLHSTRASSLSGSCPPAAQITSQTLRRSFSSNFAERPPSPARSSSGLRCSWAESSRRSLGFSGSARGSFDQQESCPTSPRSGWSSYSSSPSCLSPRAGLQSPLSPNRLTPGKGTLGGQHFTSVPWPDVRELSNRYNEAESLDTSATSTVIASSPSPLSTLSHSLLSSPDPSDSQTEWGDPELEEGHCRSQLICAYVAQPFREQALSSSGMTSPPPAPCQHQNYPSEVKPQAQVQIATKTPPVPSVHSPLPSSSSPLHFAHSSPTKPGNQKTSYATTVNLQIAGSGRITSFSTAQVSLTQTLQGGAGAGTGGPGQGQMARRVSINGLSHLPSPLPQNCNRL
ncbi:serine-rich adhesin for platelets isoform X3 [Toxotes jaculatrix]|uniref:serine-rich adhesin for platelets isoform X3 n=1 Tax=Toxotes jaculatrix TaxID=941984 RepID=UPI001B3A9810|nr:serine-rich adhesin for platelets isoform X3 [Toxotes jaculatrix]